MRYDTIIVGAGSAGAILAARLSEDRDRSVLLLEAGPDYPEFDQIPEEIKYAYGRDKNIWVRALGPTSKHNWNFVAKATDMNHSMLVPRGKIVGGSSAINVMVFLRGVPEDYDHWASLGNDKWSFRELLPYFRKLEADRDFAGEFHGTDGPIIARRFKQGELNPDQKAFYNACREAGFPECPDHNDPDSTGVGPSAYNNPDGIRWSTAIGYLSQARPRPNLTIDAACLVHRVVFEGKTATGLMVERDGETFNVYGHEIILSAGAIGSPHILLLSGVGPAGQLGALGIPLVNDSPGVGQNLRDHPSVQLTWKTKPGFKQDILGPRVQVILRYTAPGSDLRNDMIVYAGSLASQAGYYYSFESEPEGICMSPTVNLAMGAGELRLQSADPHVQPALDYRYLEDPFDRQRLRQGMQQCIELAKRPDLSRLIDTLVDPTDSDLESEEALDDWMTRKVATSHHSSATCKMGPAGDHMAVVDQYVKVHGIENLRVVDASIMPDCVRANTNVTSMVIGERAADLIRQGL